MQGEGIVQPKHPICIALLCLLLVVLVSCSQIQKNAAQGPSAPPVSSLLVLPVDPVSSVKEDINEEQLKELRQGAVVLDELLASYLEKRKVAGLTIIDESQFEGYIGERTDSRLALGVMVAKLMGKDAVLAVRLSRFGERQGANYAVKSPATLAFEYRLVSADNGAMLCSGMYDESQESLFENLFSFSGRKSFRWLPIREFATDALQEKLDGCPVLGPVPSP